MSSERDNALTFESDHELEVWRQERRDYLAETGRDVEDCDCWVRAALDATKNPKP